MYHHPLFRLVSMWQTTGYRTPGWQYCIDPHLRGTGAETSLWTLNLAPTWAPHKHLNIAHTYRCTPSSYLQIPNPCIKSYDVSISASDPAQLHLIWTLEPTHHVRINTLTPRHIKIPLQAICNLHIPTGPDWKAILSARRRRLRGVLIQLGIMATPTHVLTPHRWRQQTGVFPINLMESI